MQAVEKLCSVLLDYLRTSNLTIVYYSSRKGVNVFSLGQVTDIDEARDVAEYPLHRRLAQKIVDYINNETISAVQDSVQSVLTFIRQQRLPLQHAQRQNSN